VAFRLAASILIKGGSMRKSVGFVTAALLLAAPVQARDWSDQTTGRQTGAFVGAQLHVPLGGKTKAEPRASLGVAPTFTRVSTHGIHTSIGEGLALNLALKSKPQLTLAGVRADRALGLAARDGPDMEAKNGISTGGWIAIGVGTVLVAGAVGFALWVDSIEDNED
jgi:hypothetical protein